MKFHCTKIRGQRINMGMQKKPRAGTTISDEDSILFVSCRITCVMYARGSIFCPDHSKVDRGWLFSLARTSMSGIMSRLIFICDCVKYICMHLKKLKTNKNNYTNDLEAKQKNVKFH